MIESFIPPHPWATYIQKATRLVAIALREPTNCVNPMIFFLLMRQIAFVSRSALVPTATNVKILTDFLYQRQMIGNALKGELQAAVENISSLVKFLQQPVHLSSETMNQCGDYIETAGVLLAQWTETAPDTAPESLASLIPLMQLFLVDIRQSPGPFTTKLIQALTEFLYASRMLEQGGQQLH